MEKWSPRKYQREAAAAIERFNGRAVLGDEPGLGKTLETLLWCKRNPGVRPVIIVCPAGAKYHWKRECEEKFGFRADVVGSHSPYRLITKEGRPDFVIINYDVLRSWLTELLELEPKLIVFDECHALKESRAKRTRAGKILCRDAPHLIAISGTPCINRPAELLNVLQWCRPDLFRKRIDFLNRYCGPKFTPFGWQYKGCTHAEELNDLLKRNLLIRRLKRDVMSELPAKQCSVVPMEMSDPKQYKQAKEDFLNWLVKLDPLKASRAAKAQKVTQMGYLLRLAAQLKMRSVFSWLDSWLEETTDKLLVGAVHKAVIAALRERYEGKCVVVDGDTKMETRLGIFDRFNKDRSVRFLFGNIQAAGTIYSAKAPAAAMVEFPWTPGELNQFVDRIHGQGRGIEGRASTIYFLPAYQSIEVRLLEILEGKQKTLSAVLDGGPTGEEMLVTDLLAEALLKEREVQSGDGRKGKTR